MPWSVSLAFPQTLCVRSQQSCARLAHRNCLRSEMLRIRRSRRAPFEFVVNVTVVAVKADDVARVSLKRRQRIDRRARSAWHRQWSHSQQKRPALSCGGGLTDGLE